MREETREAAARGEEKLRIDDFHLLSQRRFAGKRQRFGDEGRIARADQYLAPCFDHGDWPQRRLAVRQPADRLADQLAEQSLPGFPAVERVAVMRQQVYKFGFG